LKYVAFSPSPDSHAEILLSKLLWHFSVNNKNLNAEEAEGAEEAEEHPK
jgi:hypothetical protein